MPKRVHVEHCGCEVRTGAGVLGSNLESLRALGSPSGICAKCGETIRIQHWDHSSIIERLGPAHRRIGFLGTGPYRLPTDHPGVQYLYAATEDLFKLSAWCTRCFGLGLLENWNGGFRECPYCFGVGRIPTAPTAHLQEAHHLWFNPWPEYHRRSPLYGIEDAVKTGAAQSYCGVAIPFLVEPDSQLVYGPVPFAQIDGEQAWTFIPRPHAERRAQTMQAVFAAKTWGELRRAIHPDDRHLIVDPDWEEDEVPADVDVFNSDWFGEYPPSPQSDFGDWFPHEAGEPFEGELLYELGLQEAYRVRDVPAIVAHLERHGFWVIRDDHLVSAAHMPDTVLDARAIATNLTGNSDWPEWIIFHVPHAATVIPEDIRGTLTVDDEDLKKELERLTDHDVDLLLVPSGILGQAVAAAVSRLVVDVERFPDDTEEPAAEVGMGAVYTRTHDGRPLRGHLSEHDRKDLLDTYYYPHHRRLAQAVNTALERHDRALILDLHSFPEEPLPTELEPMPDRPDVCLGTDPFHTPETLVHGVRDGLASAGFNVTIDRPYSGTMVPAEHHRSDPRVTSMMVEVNRRIYRPPGAVDRYRLVNDVGDALQACIRRAVVSWAYPYASTNP